jgi:hypothetical protein
VGGCLGGILVFQDGSLRLVSGFVAELAGVVASVIDSFLGIVPGLTDGIA